MDILESPYFRINKFLLICLGVWPFQRRLYKNMIRITQASINVSIVIPEVMKLREVWPDLDYSMDCVSVLAVLLVNNVKLSNYILNASMMKKLMNRIKHDWNADIFEPQLEILKAYAEQGKRLTEIYFVYMYSTLGMYILMPVMPKILDLVMPLNESRTVVYPIPVKYGDLDTDNYYFPIMLHADAAGLISITTIVAMDTTYCVYVQHACGIFAMLGDRIERLIISDNYDGLDEISAKRKEKAIYQAFVTCIKMHKEAIEFANAIEASHFVVFFFVIGISIMCLSVAGYQMVMHLDEPNEAIRFATFTLAQIAHMFFISWPGQKLIDHSERIYEWAYGAKWYQASHRSKKLLMIMMLRSVEPCKLTAGKLYVMSLSNFSMVVRTSMSYFTVLTSFR